MWSANAVAKKIAPNGPRTKTAVITGCSAGIASFTPQPAAAPAAAQVQSFATYDAARPVRPMRALSAARSRYISTQPAAPADAVRPAAPHTGSTPSQCGTGIAHT